MAQSKTYFCLIRVTTLGLDGNTNTKNLGFRIHDSSGSQLSKLLDYKRGVVLTLDLDQREALIMDVGDGTELLLKLSAIPLGEIVVLWVSDQPKRETIYEREFRIDLSRYAEKGLDMREGTRYALASGANNMEPTCNSLVLGLLCFLGITPPTIPD